MVPFEANECPIVEFCNEMQFAKREDGRAERSERFKPEKAAKFCDEVMIGGESSSVDDLPRLPSTPFGHTPSTGVSI